MGCKKGNPSPRAAEAIMMSLSAQPYPLFTQAAEKKVGDQVLTAIHRRWRPGQSKHCRLCPLGACTAYEDSCLILTAQPVGSGQEIALFRALEVVTTAPGPTPFSGIHIHDPAPNGGPGIVSPVRRGEVLDLDVPLEARQEESRLVGVQRDPLDAPQENLRLTVREPMHGPDVVEAEVPAAGAHPS